MDGFIDVTAVLRSGVYILRLRGRVVFVGQGKVVLAKVYAHRAHRRGQPAPAWLPTRPIEFDEVFIKTCRVDLLDTVYRNTCAEVGWEAASVTRTAEVFPLERRA